MNHHECCRSITRIAQNTFQIHDVALRKIEVIADADRGMNMHWQMQASAFLNQVAKDKVLEGAIFLLRRNAPTDEALVDIFGLRRTGIAESRGTEVGNFELHRNSAALGIIFQRAADEVQVVSERSRQFADVLLLPPAMQHLFLQWNVDALVGIAPRLSLIVERPHKGVSEEDPRKTL